MLLNCVLVKSLDSPLDCKEIQPVHPKGNQSWIFIGRTDAEAETPILWPPDAKSWLILKRPWGWERLKAGGEGDHRGWDGWMASPTQWTWVWVNSGSWWWTGRPGVLRFMGLQRVGLDWAIELKYLLIPGFLWTSLPGWNFYFYTGFHCFYHINCNSPNFSKSLHLTSHSTHFAEWVLGTWLAWWLDYIYIFIHTHS